MSYYHPGPNPTSDCAIFSRAADGSIQLLLGQRAANSPAEPGKWALPGGFVNSLTGRGEPHSMAETPASAAAREVQEETGVRVDASALTFVGVFEGGGRDPRDSERAWSKSHAFAILLPAASIDAPVGMDDMSEARFFPIPELRTLSLAFDHQKIISQSATALGIPDPFSNEAAPRRAPR